VRILELLEAEHIAVEGNRALGIANSQHDRSADESV